MHNFAHKESEYRCCPSPKPVTVWPVAAMHQQDPPRRKSHQGSTATWRWLLWTQPAGTDEPGTLAAKNVKEIETVRGSKETRNKKQETRNQKEKKKRGRGV